MTVLIVENMAALRALPSTSYLLQPDVQLRGYHAAGDGGCGTFCWDECSTQPDNDDTVIQPDDVAGGRPGRLIRLFAGPLGNIGPDRICLQLDLAATDDDTKPVDARLADRSGFWSW